MGSYVLDKFLAGESCYGQPAETHIKQHITLPVKKAYRHFHCMIFVSFGWLFSVFMLSAVSWVLSHYMKLL